MKSALPASEDSSHYVASGVAGTSRFGSVMKCSGHYHVITNDKPQQETRNA